MKNYILLSLFCLIFFAGCKNEIIEANPPEVRFAKAIVGRWIFSSYTSKTNNADGTVTDNGSTALPPASSISFRADGTLTIIEFGISQTEGTYKILSDNELTITTSQGTSRCIAPSGLTSKSFVFTGRADNGDGSVDYTTYYLSDRTAL